MHGMQTAISKVVNSAQVCPRERALAKIEGPETGMGEITEQMQKTDKSLFEILVSLT
jgi:hypothetical protein